ncbi:MAG TPA: sigma 54-interacting transcriptional regulator, partial [Byssovorax sp.]
MTSREPGARGRVLVVDPDARTRRSIARALLERGFDVDTAEDADAALALDELRARDAMLLDLDVGAATGAATIARVIARAPGLVVVGAAALGATSLGAWPFDAGAYDVVEKRPASDDTTARALDRAVERAGLVAARHALEQRRAEEDPLGEIVAASAPMREVLRLVDAVARAGTSALIVGEAGAGKDVVARAIHARSARAAAPLFSIDCAALDATTLEAELFGEASASADRPGLVEAADGATLVLEGLASLPASAAARLVRVLARGETRRVGEADPRRVDVRVLATSREELPLAARGPVDHELRLRVGPVVVRVPKLSQRKDDLPILAARFLKAAAVRAGRDVRRVSVEAMRALREHPWPGNVRELAAAIEHAVTVARGDVVYPHDLPFHRSEPKEVSATSGARFGRDLLDLPYADAKRAAVDAFDRAYVARALAGASGNVSEAARRAG